MKKAYRVLHRHVGETEWQYDPNEGEWETRWEAVRRAGHMGACCHGSVEFTVERVR